MHQDELEFTGYQLRQQQIRECNQILKEGRKQAEVAVSPVKDGDDALNNSENKYHTPTHSKK